MSKWFLARELLRESIVSSGNYLIPNRGSEVMDYGVPYDFHDSEEESGLE